MSEHDHDIKTAPPVRADDVRGAPKGEKADVERPDPEATKKKIEKILHGKSKDEGELPRLVSLLDGAGQSAFFTDSFPTLGKVVSGDTVFKVGDVSSLNVGVVLDVALAAKQKPSKAALRAYLSGHRDQLGALTGDRLTHVRGQLTGAILDELPAVADRVDSLSPEMLEWFVDTTPPAIAAFAFSKSGSEELGEKLDALTTPKKWEWVDHLHRAQSFVQLAALAKKAPPAIKQKIETKLGPVAGADRDVESFRQDSRKTLDTLLEGKPKLQELLDAIAAVGALTNEEAPKVIRELKALGPSADDVLALSTNTPIESSTMLGLLLASKDVTRKHLEMFLFTDYSVLDTLAKGSLVADVRKLVPDLKFRELLAYSDGSEQGRLLDNDALRGWFFETASAEDKLWFCGSGNDSVRACKLMEKRDPTWKWVYELSASADRRQLRAVALNCGHDSVTKHIRNVLLVDNNDFHQVISGAVDPQLETKSGETGRLLDTLADGGDLMARLADLDDGERSRYGKIDTFVTQLAANLGGADFARAATLLNLSFSSVVEHAPAPAPAIVAYLRTRPRAEELEAAGHLDLVERSITHVHPDPLVVFPTLREPEQLAKVLDHNAKLIKILFKHADPSTVADLLSREPVIAATERALAKDNSLLKYLPDARGMSSKGREGVDRLAKQSKDEDVTAELADLKDNNHIVDPTVRDEAAKMTGARKQGTLSAALEELLAKGASSQSVMPLLGEFPGDELRKLLSEDAHSKLVGDLAQALGLPAQVVFPQLGLETLLGLRNSRAWLFDYDQVTVLLDLAADRPAALEKIAKELDHGSGANALIWLGRLPQGSALTDGEVHALDRMQPFIKDVATLRLLFKVRYGTTAPAGEDATTLASLYKTICRLPRSHLNQERISQFVEKPMGYAGMWTGTEVELEPGLKPTDTKDDDDTFHPTAQRLTKAHIMRLYGWTELDLGVQVKLGNVKFYPAADQYEVAAKKVDKFTSTVLHEIGHSVDDILGQRTEAVFGDFAKWKAYAPADFEQWAQEQGGWDKVSPGDQKKIREVWLDAIRSRDQVQNLVDKDHPALAKHYEDAGVGVVASARKNLTYDHTDPVQIGDRGFIVNSYYHQFFSVSARAVDSKPSTYSMYAPQEYFAECYVEFYRGYDGSAATKGHKGGALPQPVKNWFANHVDTLKYDPQRFEKSSDEEDAG